MKVLYFLLLLLQVVRLFAQKEKLPLKHSIYAEALGNGGYGSLNYECQFYTFRQHKISWSARLGMGSNNLIDFENRFNPDLIFPVGIHSYYGKNHQLELGINSMLSLIVQYKPDLYPYRKIHSHLGFSIGYRYRQLPKGLIAGIRYTPILEFYKHYRHWAAVYVGYCF